MYFFRRRGINLTIKDIAKIAGVSHSTVSRSLNDSPRVNRKTKEKIQKIASDLEFEFHAGARSLSTKKTGTVGIVHPGIFTDPNTQPFCASLLEEIRRKLSKTGIDYIPVFSEAHDYTASNIIRLTRQKKVDAFLVIDSQVSSEEWKFLHKYRVPFIQLHYKPLYAPTEGMNFIFSDNFTGGRIATNHLIEHGCTKIMCIAIKSVHSEILDRTEGYLASLREHGLTVDKNLILTEDYSFFNGEKLIRENRDLAGKVDGIFVHADLMALGVIKGLKALGYSVPRDIRIVGYDDIEMGTYYDPALTTIHQPKEELAEKACARLNDLLKKNEGDVLQEVIQPRLIVRESC